MTRKMSRDHYFQKAKSAGYLARSVFKLQEIDTRFKILGPNQTVLDLGASPGSWSQYAAQKVGRNGRVVAVDLKPAGAEIPGVEWRVGDVTELDMEALIAEHGRFDVLLSDMAPKTTGQKKLDSLRSVALAESAFDLALRGLKPGGRVVVKVFTGPDFQDLVKFVRERFKKSRGIKPKACLKESRETYLVAWEPKK